MAYIETLLMGMLAGVTAGFPVSSSGSVILLGNVFSLELDARLYSAILLGVIAAIAVSFRTDLIRLVAALIGILVDLVRNAKTFLIDRIRRSAYGYRRVLSGNYRRMLIVMLIALIPTLLIGALIRPFTGFAYSHLLIIAMGFLITALILLVSSFVEVPDRGPKSLKVSDAIILGVFQGFSFVPGISRIAASSSSGFLCGLTRRLLIKMAFLMSMFCMLAQALPGPFRPDGLIGEKSSAVLCVVGAGSSFIVSLLVLQMAKRMIRREKIRTFSITNAIIAAVAVLIYMIRH